MIEAGTPLIHHTGAHYEFVCVATWCSDGKPWFSAGVYQSCTDDNNLHVFVRPINEFLDIIPLPGGLEVQRFTDANAERKICRGCGDWTLPICSTCKVSTCENCASTHALSHQSTPED